MSFGKNMLHDSITPLITGVLHLAGTNFNSKVVLQFNTRIQHQNTHRHTTKHTLMTQICLSFQTKSKKITSLKGITQLNSLGKSLSQTKSGSLKTPPKLREPPRLTVTTFFPSTPRPRPLKVICTVTKPKQSTELLGPTPSKYMASRGLETNVS